MDRLNAGTGSVRVCVCVDYLNEELGYGRNGAVIISE